MPARVFRSLSLTGLAVALAMSLLVVAAQQTAPNDAFGIPQPRPAAAQRTPNGTDLSIPLPSPLGTKNRRQAASS